jgi:DNA-binding CsgD family transcriptional regulator/tetratricopeptide (TPR) repeat protein
VSSFLLRHAACRQPLLLILEDLHWADTSSLLLLQFLAPRVNEAPLFVLGTYRDDETISGDALDRVVATVQKEQRGYHLTLTGLNRGETIRLIEGIAGVAPSAGVADLIHEQTEGNPLFITEIVRLHMGDWDPGRLGSTDAWRGIAPRGGESRLQPVPASIREVIERRLRRLSPECGRVLIAAAVIGRGFDLETTGTVVERSGAYLLDLIGEAESARIIAPVSPGEYRFSHALIRETLYATLTAAQRSRLHGQVGAVLEQQRASNLEPHLTELAYHFSHAAGDADRVRAVAYAVRAAERATRLHAHEDAVRQYELALRMLASSKRTDERARCDLLLARGQALIRAGENEQAQQTFLQAADSARMVEDAERLASAALGFGDASVTLGYVDLVLVRLIEEALAATGAGDSATRAKLIGRLASALYWSPSRERSDALSREAVQIARRVGDAGALAAALTDRATVLSGGENLEERLETATELLRAVEASSDIARLPAAQDTRIEILLKLGDVTAVNIAIDAQARLSDLLRQPDHRRHVAALRTLQALFDGRFADAERLLAETWEARGGRDMRRVYHQMLFLRREQGRCGELLEEFRALARAYPSAPYGVPIAFILSEIGRHDEARDLLRRAAVGGFADVIDSYGKAYFLALLSEVCSALGDQEQSGRLYDLLLPWDGRQIGFGTTICLGPASLYLGMLSAVIGRPETDQRYQDAIDSCRRTGAAPWLARAQYRYAGLLLGRARPEDREQGLQLAQAARRTADDLGMTLLSEQVMQLLARSAPGASSTAQVPVPLTHREIEVLRLLATGMSNREIAHALVVSVRTVDHHIANIYSKIDAREGAEATAYAFRHGIVTDPR